MRWTETCAPRAPRAVGGNGEEGEGEGYDHGEGEGDAEGGGGSEGEEEEDGDGDEEAEEEEEEKEESRGGGGRKREAVPMFDADGNFRHGAGAGDDAAGSSACDGHSHSLAGNRCDLLWQGTLPKRCFTGFKFLESESHAAGRKLLKSRGVGHYWDMVENADSFLSSSASFGDDF
jgi:hypothetical protein